MKGGGDAVSAARAVLQTGEYDFAWNMQVEDEILKRLEKRRQGQASSSSPAATSSSSSSTSPIPGPRSTASAPASRPSIRCFTDPAVREALALLVDRESIQEYIYGRTGIATANFLNNPGASARKNTKCEFNIEKANQMLEDAGWKKGADGIRAKDGKKLKFVYQTSINAPAPEDPGHRQAGLPEGRHRHRAEVGDGLGVLLLRRRQPRHLRASSTADIADVHDHR